MQTGVAKGLKVPCLFMINEVSIRCQKKSRRLVYAVYPRIPPPNTPLAPPKSSWDRGLVSAAWKAPLWARVICFSIHLWSTKSLLVLTICKTVRSKLVTGSIFRKQRVAACWWGMHPLHPSLQDPPLAHSTSSDLLAEYKGH